MFNEYTTIQTLLISTVIKHCFLYCMQDHLNFMIKMFKSYCYLLQHLFSVTACAQMWNILDRYNVHESISYNKFRYVLWTKFYNDLLVD
jgi:hypothetical protein